MSEEEISEESEEIDEVVYARDAEERIDVGLETIEKCLVELQKPIVEVSEAERKAHALARVVKWFEQIHLAKKALTEMESAMLTAVERERYKEEFIPLSDDNVVELGYNAGGGRSWDHDRLRPVLIEAIIDEHVDEETGVIEAPVSQLISEALDVAGIGYWKTTELDRYNIKANDYSTKKPRKFKAKVHRND